MMLVSMGLGEQIRKLFRIFFLFTVLVAVALISAITTIRLSIHGHQTAAPNVVGLTVEAADRALAVQGLDLQVEDKLYSAKYAANQIISQIPSAGVTMKSGQHVHVLVSLGAPRLSIPNIIGSSARAAQISAVQQGLSIGEIARAHIEGSDPDQIVSQDPPPEGAVIHAPAVSLLVSLGAPVPAFVCPRLKGRSLGEVRAVLEKAGFQVGQITPVPDANVPPGTILSQSPLPGSRIVSGTAFQFQVAQ